MGIYSSSTENKTEIAAPSTQEKAIMEMMVGALMPASLEAQGYEVTETRKTYEDTAEYDQFSSRRNRLAQEREELLNQLEAQGKQQGFGTNQQRQSAQIRNQQQIQQEISEINAKLDNVDSEEQDFLKDFDPEITYDTRKLDSPEVERARKLYGTEDERYKSLKNEYEESKVEQYDTKANIEELFMEKTQKFLNGDFAITEEQRELIKENMAPTRAAVTKMFDEARSEARSTENKMLTSLAQTFNEFDKRVKSTYLNTYDALEVVGRQINKTGTDMESALNKTITTQKELLEMGIEDYSGKVLKQISNNAAMLNRSPDDPEFKEQIAQTIAREVKSGVLNLASMESQGMLSIKERTGGALEQLGMTKADLTRQRGEKLEQSSLSKGQQEMGIIDQYGNQRTQLGLMEGQSNVGLEDQAANLRWQVGSNMAPQQVSLGMGVSQYQEAINQQNIQNSRTAMQTPMPLIDYYARERHAQPTTTQTSNPSTFGSIMSGAVGLASSAASAYSGVTQASAMRDMGSMYNAPSVNSRW